MAGIYARPKKALLRPMMDTVTDVDGVEVVVPEGVDVTFTNQGIADLKIIVKYTGKDGWQETVCTTNTSLRSAIEQLMNKVYKRNEKVRLENLYNDIVAKIDKVEEVIDIHKQVAEDSPDLYPDDNAVKALEITVRNLAYQLHETYLEIKRIDKLEQD